MVNKTFEAIGFSSDSSSTIGTLISSKYVLGRSINPVLFDALIMELNKMVAPARTIMTISTRSIKKF